MIGRSKQLQLEAEQLKEALLDQIQALRREVSEKDKLVRAATLRQRQET